MAKQFQPLNEAHCSFRCIGACLRASLLTHTNTKQPLQTAWQSLSTRHPSQRLQNCPQSPWVSLLMRAQKAAGSSMQHSMTRTLLHTI